MVAFCSLSVEGCNVEDMNGGWIDMVFHIHFADKSVQNSVLTHAHMEVLLDNLFERKNCSKIQHCENLLMVVTSSTDKMLLSIC